MPMRDYAIIASWKGAAADFGIVVVCAAAIGVIVGIALAAALFPVKLATLLLWGV